MFSLSILLLTSAVLDLVYSSEPEPLRVDWSDTTYGPNGPWYAVSVKIGTPPRAVDVFPSNIFSSWIPNQNFCSNKTLDQDLDKRCPKDHAIWDYSKSQSVQQVAPTDGLTIPSFVAPETLVFGGQYLLDTIQIGDSQHVIPNCSIYSMDYGYYTSTPPGGGSIYNVGTLGLSGQANSLPKMGASVPLTYLSGRKKIPTLSYALQIGSVGAKISPSLYIGGYDQSRALGPLLRGSIPPVPSKQNTSQPTPRYLYVTLEDITVDTAGGQLPAYLPPPDHSLLSMEGTSGPAQSFQVGFQIDIPYMHLPDYVCDNFQKILPLTFHSQTGMYLWQTSDPLYQEIMASHSYAKFTFKSELSGRSVSIRVPWKLFDLELESPLVSTPARYFPCSRSFPGTAGYMLGRSFLQSAYLVLDWRGPINDSYFYIAQAPGPNIASRPSIQTFVAGVSHPTGDDDVTWESTWGFPDGNQNSNNSSGSGLSQNAKIGIGVGIGLVLPSLIGLAVFCFVSRRRTRQFVESKLKKSEKKQPAIRAAELQCNPYWPKPNLNEKPLPPPPEPIIAPRRGRWFQLYGSLPEIPGRQIHEAPGPATMGDPENPAEAAGGDMAGATLYLNSRTAAELQATPLSTPSISISKVSTTESSESSSHFETPTESLGTPIQYQDPRRTSAARSVDSSFELYSRYLERFP